MRGADTRGAGDVADLSKWIDCPAPLLAARVAEVAGGLSGDARAILMAAAYRLTRKVTDERVREIAREESVKVVGPLKETLKLLAEVGRAGFSAILEARR